MRTTQSEVHGMFNRLAKAMNKRIDRNAGSLSLDYNSCYGGYVIVENLENGGESHPFGSLRRSAKEMYLSLYMASVALEEWGNNGII
jgi:hypothetical protein